MEAVDVKTAFLYGKLDEEIYMQRPEGFRLKGQETKVLRLHCYDFRQPRQVIDSHSFRVLSEPIRVLARLLVYLMV